MNILKIGTRGSKLALYQANEVKQTIEKVFPNTKVEILVIKTKGDKILDVSLSKIGDKGLFTKEIEDCLLSNEVDIAVHSLKDLPTNLPEGLKISGVLPRHEVRDALITTTGKKLKDLDATDTIATSSLRRKAQLLSYNPNLNIIDIRGNVETRLKKLHDGYCTALIMAGAGLLRLGYDSEISELIDPDIIIPAVSQGIIAIESKSDRPEVDAIIARINHVDSYIIGEAERTFMRKLEGGCQVPVALYSKKYDAQVEFSGYVGSLNGSKYLKRTISGDFLVAETLAEKLANELILNGGDKILAEIRAE